MIESQHKARMIMSFLSQNCRFQEKNTSGSVLHFFHLLPKILDCRGLFFFLEYFVHWWDRAKFIQIRRNRPGISLRRDTAASHRAPLIESPERTEAPDVRTLPLALEIPEIPYQHFWVCWFCVRWELQQYFLASDTRCRESSVYSTKADLFGTWARQTNIYNDNSPFALKKHSIPAQF